MTLTYSSSLMNQALHMSSITDFFFFLMFSISTIVTQYQVLVSGKNLLFIQNETRI